MSLEASTLHHVFQQMDVHKTLSLATSVENIPWISSVFFSPAFTFEDAYAQEKLVLYCTVMRGSHKLKNLHQNANVSFSLQHVLPTNWIQGAGIATEITDPAEVDQAIQKILAKSPEAIYFTKVVPMTAIKIEVSFVKLTDTTVTPPLFLQHQFKTIQTITS